MDPVNVVLMDSCTHCRHIMFRMRWRHVECWYGGGYASKRTIIDQEQSKKLITVPIPDWCPLGVHKVDTLKLEEWAEFDGKLRRLEQGPLLKKGGCHGTLE